MKSQHYEDNLLRSPCSLCRALDLVQDARMETRQKKEKKKMRNVNPETLSTRIIIILSL